MLKKGLLWIACVLFVASGSAFAEQASMEKALELEVAAERVAVESVDAVKIEDGNAEVWNSPEWIHQDADTDCSAGATTNWGPLDPGGCNDCAGGCSITCSNHMHCMQKCPNNIGSCTQSGRCLCAC